MFPSVAVVDAGWRLAPGGRRRGRRVACAVVAVARPHHRHHGVPPGLDVGCGSRIGRRDPAVAVVRLGQRRHRSPSRRDHDCRGGRAFGHRAGGGLGSSDRSRGLASQARSGPAALSPVVRNRREAGRQPRSVADRIQVRCARTGPDGGDVPHSVGGSRRRRTSRHAATGGGSSARPRRRSSLDRRA